MRPSRSSGTPRPPGRVRRSERTDAPRLVARAAPAQQAFVENDRFDIEGVTLERLVQVASDRLREREAAIGGETREREVRAERTGLGGEAERRERTLHLRGQDRACVDVALEREPKNPRVA